MHRGQALTLKHTMLRPVYSVTPQPFKVQSHIAILVSTVGSPPNSKDFSENAFQQLNLYVFDRFTVCLIQRAQLL